MYIKNVVAKFVGASRACPLLQSHANNRGEIIWVFLMKLEKKHLKQQAK